MAAGEAGSDAFRGVVHRNAGNSTAHGFLNTTGEITLRNLTLQRARVPDPFVDGLLRPPRRQA